MIVSTLPGYQPLQTAWYHSHHRWNITVELTLLKLCLTAGHGRELERRLIRREKATTPVTASRLTSFVYFLNIGNYFAKSNGRDTKRGNFPDAKPQHEVWAREHGFFCCHTTPLQKVKYEIHTWPFLAYIVA